MKTQVIENKDEMRNTIDALKKKGATVGFVPTMGALHEGHLSLVRTAKKENDVVIVSVFVNPTQFGKGEDFLSYPRDFERDKRLLEDEKVDLIFHPSAEEMCQTDDCTDSSADAKRRKSRKAVAKKKELKIPHRLTACLCAKDRPGHFEGVVSIVEKLFSLIRPDRAYFGQKDYQQARMVSWLVETRKFPIELRTIPTIREKSGLAMSSRNAYLKPEERKTAQVLYDALKFAKKMFDLGARDSGLIKRKMRDLIIQKIPSSQMGNFRINYLEIRKTDLSGITGKIDDDAVIAVSATIGKTRLIDNVIVHGEKKTATRGNVLIKKRGNKP